MTIYLGNAESKGNLVERRIGMCMIDIVAMRTGMQPLDLFLAVEGGDHL